LNCSLLVPISLPLLLGEGAWMASSEVNAYIVRLLGNIGCK